MPSTLTKDQLLTIFKAQYTTGTNPISDSAVHFFEDSSTNEITTFTSPTDDTTAARAAMSSEARRTLAFTVKIDNPADPSAPFTKTLSIIYGNTIQGANDLA